MCKGWKPLNNDRHTRQYGVRSLRYSPWRVLYILHFCASDMTQTIKNADWNNTVSDWIYSTWDASAREFEKGRWFLGDCGGLWKTKIVLSIVSYSQVSSFTWNITAAAHIDKSQTVFVFSRATGEGFFQRHCELDLPSTVTVRCGIVRQFMNAVRRRNLLK